MRIALCLSGHLRTFRHTYQSFYEQLINRYDCDVFISTWKNLGCKFCYGAHYAEGKDNDDPVVDQSEIESLFKPRSIVMGDADTNETSVRLKKDFDGIKTQNGAQVAQTMIMLYKIWECNQLKREHEQKNGFLYDVVIRSRFDILLKRMDLDKAIQTVQFVPSHTGVCDLVFVGASKAMNNVCDIYTILSTEIPFGNFVNIEQILATHLENNDIPFDSSGTSFEYVRYSNGGIYDMYGKKVGDY